MKKKALPLRAWAKIRLLAVDVDGVLTDGSVTICTGAGETKTFSIIDGLGMILIRNAGVQVAWISGRKSLTTDMRSAELKIEHVIQGRHDKLEALTDLAAMLCIPLSECAYMGDDVIDAPAILAAGIGISVPTGLPIAIKCADYVTKRLPGNGAVREVCDLILDSRGKPSGNYLVPKLSK
ncbi:MAG TPA: HAD hydrolase family protein [Opitutaceae bacterium]|nr:HAD hydrolase family protein [Opitutaceae bacterium]